MRGTHASAIMRGTHAIMRGTHASAFAAVVCLGLAISDAADTSTEATATPTYKLGSEGVCPCWYEPYNASSSDDCLEAALSVGPGLVLVLVLVPHVWRRRKMHLC